MSTRFQKLSVYGWALARLARRLCGWTQAAARLGCVRPAAGRLLGRLGIRRRSGAWTAIILRCAGALLLTIFEPVTWVLTSELAGESRATANGLLATSNQL